MSIVIEADTIRLIGACPVEDAETLHLALQEAAERRIDLFEATRLHLAVVQVLAAARAPIAVPPEEAFLRDLLMPALIEIDHTSCASDAL